MAYLGNSPANALFNLTPPVTLSAGQTVVNINYTPGRTLFLLNGALLSADDITAINGSAATLTRAAVAGDVLVAVNFASFSVGNALPLSGGVMGGPIAFAGGDTGVTPAAGDNSTLLATTAFAQGFAGGRKQIFTSSGSFTAPPGVTQAWVSGTGAGAGGGASLATNSASFVTGGSGGGAGQWVIRQLVTLVPGQTYPVTIGAGGTGGTAAANNATAGGATQFGTSGALLNLAGGSRGSLGSGGTAIGAYGGPAGGAGYPSGDWASDTVALSSGSGVGGFGGRGGCNPFGNAGPPGRGAAGSCPSALAGSGYGAGGSGAGGAYSSSTSAPGGSGAAGLPGLFMIEW